MRYDFVVLDTNFYFNHGDELDKFGTVFLNTTIIEEIDHLKESNSPEKSYKARRVSRAIEKAENIKFVNPSLISNNFGDLDMSRNDNKIIQFAKTMQTLHSDLVLITDDLNVVFKCQLVDMPVVKWRNKDNIDDVYTGFKEITLTDEELATHYLEPINRYKLKDNEYLIIRNSQGEVVDKQRWSSQQGFISLNSKPLVSKYLGEIKSRDIYQMFALDSLRNADFTLLFGKAGTAKTLLSLAWIMQNIQNNKINKCVIMFNGIPLKNNQALGFYPGTKDDKLLQSGLGSILSSKLGDMTIVERLISEGRLLLIPTAEIRGVEVSEDDCLFVTEAQNTDAYTMRTILQRAKKGTKIIIEGDLLEQQDIRHCSQNENGMVRAVEVFKGTPYFSCVKLQNVYRSPIAEIADLL